MYLSPMENIINLSFILGCCSIFGLIVVGIQPLVENMDIIMGRHEYARKREGWYYIFESIISQSIGRNLIVATIGFFLVWIILKCI